MYTGCLPARWMSGGRPAGSSIGTDTFLAIRARAFVIDADGEKVDVGATRATPPHAKSATASAGAAIHVFDRTNCRVMFPPPSEVRRSPPRVGFRRSG